MAVITDPTFDFMLQYSNVRMQQGVPIVDADLNELDDIRKFEVRSNQKWLVGNGVPADNNGFEIRGLGLANDFEISAGLVAGPTDPLRNVGHCIVNGLDVVIDADINYTAQPLHTSQGGSAALAAILGVPVIAPMPALPPPAANATVSVYLDVWERLLSPAEQPALVHPALGIESCARMERRWAVRIRIGTGVPVSGDADFLPVPGDLNHQNEHSYYLLATISRRPAATPGANIVRPADVTDVREQQLFMPPATLIQDLFGVDAIPYRRGEGRPGVSLRAAINSLMRGELPASLEQNVSTHALPDFPGRSAIVDGSGHLWVFGSRSNDIWARRNVNGVWEAEQVVSAGENDSQPVAVLDSNGDIWVFWLRAISPLIQRIQFRIHRHTSDTWDGEATVPTGVGRPRDPQVVSDAAGDIWLVYRFGSQIMSMSANLAAVWAGPDPRTNVGTSQTPYLLADNSGGVWLFYTGRGRPGTPERRIYSQFKAAAAAWPAVGTEQRRSGTATSTQDRSAFAAEIVSGNVLLAWDAQIAGGARRAETAIFDAGAGVWLATEQVSAADSERSVEPFALATSDGDVWLMTVRWIAPTSSTIQVRRRAPGAGAWGPAMTMTAPGELNLSPRAAEGADGSIWLFWLGDRGGNRDVLVRQIYPSI